MVAGACLAQPAHPCVSCHPKEVAGYAVTQMAHSLARPGREPDAKFTHAASKTGFWVETKDSHMVQGLERDGVKGQYDVVYAIGSGAHAFAYIIDLGGHLFQSPIGYFPGRGWAMSPGYEESRAPDFNRPVSTDCLFCHSGRARPVSGTYNAYQDPPFEAEAITCERCHGPVEAHLKNPAPGSIVNPASLPQRARDSVCEQCHLNGEERIPNPGKQLSDFHAGENLEDVFSVYVDQASLDPAGPNPLKVVSQVQQLALSRCARESHGKMWCGTCHDPHEQPPDPKNYFRARCLSCHGAALLARHPKPSDDCIGCHMPRRPVSDGAHTVFTDHHIRRRPEPAGAESSPARPRALAAWHTPAGPLAERNLGLANVKLGERIESISLVNDGLQLLMSCWDSFPDDPALLTGLGEAAMTAGHGADAASVFERAIQLEPNVALHYLHAGLAWKTAHDDAKATRYLEKAAELDPLIEQPYLELVSIYSDDHDLVNLRRTTERYLKAFPQSIRAQVSNRRSRP